MTEENKDSGLISHIYYIKSPSYKYYVGQTSKDPEERWKKHRSAAESDSPKAGGCPAINRAIRAHGWDNMEKKIKETCPREKADEREIYWIDFYDALVPTGYNIAKGGAGCLYDRTPETLEKMGKSLKRPENKHVPTYIKQFTRNSHIGYIVAHPDYRQVEIADPRLSEKQRLNCAERLLDMIKSKNANSVNNRYRGIGFDGRKLPKYVLYSNVIDTYMLTNGNKRYIVGAHERDYEDTYNEALNKLYNKQ